MAEQRHMTIETDQGITLLDDDDGRSVYVPRDKVPLIAYWFRSYAERYPPAGRIFEESTSRPPTRHEIEQVLNGTDMQALKHLVMTDTMVAALVALGRRIEVAAQRGVKWE